MSLAMRKVAKDALVRTLEEVVATSRDHSGEGTVSGVPREGRKSEIIKLSVGGPQRDTCRGVSGTRDGEGQFLLVRALDSHGSAGLSLQPVLVALTGRTWTHPIVSSAPNTAPPNLKGLPSVPVRAAITEPPGRAPRQHAHVSPAAGPGHL